MLRVNQLRTLLQECQDEIPGINRNELVLDDSELTNFLKDFKVTDNCMLIGVMPQFNVKGQEDSIQFVNQLQFMVVKKSADKDFKNQDEYLQMFHDTQALMMLLVGKLLGEKLEDLCGDFSNIVEESISIYPVWRKAQCNGWALEIDLLS
ncbi:hypothetical protein [Flavobacterium sp.]|jgi:hypothetical protein|uniref:hypothetical protein n=1 Tax=Flavobacterium sp. TaxID=239 RepID=UPI0037BED322